MRFVHAAIEAREAAIALLADGNRLEAHAAYEFSSEYVRIEPGRHTISAENGASELIQASMEFDEGFSTIIAYSTGDFPVALSAVMDRTDLPMRGTAQIRLFHALANQGAIDVCQPSELPRGDGTALIVDVAPGTMGSPTYVSVPGGSVLSMQFRIQNATPCHGRALGTAHFTPASENNYTLVLVGRSGRHRSAPELLFCADPPAADTSCATVTIESP